MKTATATGTTSIVCSLTPPSGADGSGGYQNIKIWSIHACGTGGGAGTADLQVRYTPQDGLPNTVAFRLRQVAASGVTNSFSCEFPRGLLFPGNTGVQFDVALTMPASSTNGHVNVTYEYTSEAS